MRSCSLRRRSYYWRRHCWPDSVRRAGRRALTRRSRCARNNCQPSPWWHVLFYDMLQDLRFGLKLLGKERAFTITALLTLALCIGANTAIFTVLNAVILNPLPFPEPDRLVRMYNIYPGVGFTGRGMNSGPDYADRKSLTDVFESVAMTGSVGYDVGAEGSPLRVDGQSVMPSFFQALRVSPMLGRVFTEDEAVFQKDKFAILSYGLWRDLFGRDPNAIGKDIGLSGIPYKVVGVMPQGF